MEGSMSRSTIGVTDQWINKRRVIIPCKMMNDHDIIVLNKV